MPLQPYQYQPAGSISSRSTPSPKTQQGSHGRRPSASSLWSTPDSVDTRATTPNNTSPAKYYGTRDLLPRVRPTDQNLEPDFGRPSQQRRAASHECDSSLSVPQSRPHYQRSTTCPPESDFLPTQVPTTSSQDWVYSYNTESPLTYLPAQTRQSLGGHVRSTSTSALDASAFRTHAQPYRSRPVYVTQAQASNYVPSYVPQLADFVSMPQLENIHETYSEELPQDFIFETGYEPTSQLMSYLTSPNPKVRLVSGPRTAGDNTGKHYWWDIRQLRTWSDFNMDTITAVPGFKEILNINCNARLFPEPKLDSQACYPNDLFDLQDTINDFYATKINAALRVSQGVSRYGHMRKAKTPRDGPHFFCNYIGAGPDSLEFTSSQGRIVGLVKSYETWNTGKRRGDPNEQIEYLRPLAQLQWMMREQSCRYGFIMTEIELVCVRMGSVSDSPGGGIPFFGHLELSKPIDLNTSSSSSCSSGEPKLTACLALWYLHMLTSNTPLQGQLHWKVQIGAPADRTRQKCCKDDERDEWIRRQKGPHLIEMRPAKRVRGWVWPSDDYKPKIEGPKARRR